MIKNLTKNDIIRRFENSNYKYSVSIDKIKTFHFKSFSFTNVCEILIPGHPIIDSRPRFLEKKDGTIGTYNPHKAQLMKVFKYIYDDSPLLHGLCILGPVIIDLTIYSVAPKNYLKAIKGKDLKDLENGEIPALIKPDVDNGMKINYDVIQDLEYQILLRDEHVVKATTDKIFVKDPKDERVVIRIYYNEKLPTWYKSILFDSADYLNYTISMKYKYINQIKDEEWSKYFFRTIVEYIKRTKKNPVKTVKKILKYYKKNHLDLILVEKNAELATEKILNMVEAIYIEIKNKK